MAKKTKENEQTNSYVDEANEISGAEKFVNARKKEKKSAEQKTQAVVVQNISPELIVFNPYNPRKKIKEGEIEELAQNIKEIGILQPITVRPFFEADTNFTGYEVVCGERRLRAAELAELATVPCIVRELSDEQAFDIMIAENLQRKDIEPMEEARAFEALRSKQKISIEEMAARFGKPITFIRSRLKLNSLIKSFQTMLEDGELPVGHAIELCMMSLERQNKIYQEHYSDDEDYYSWRKINLTDLKNRLKNQLPELADFYFDKTECETCPQNTAVSELFNSDARCMSEVCFAQKYNQWRLNEILGFGSKYPNVVFAIYPERENIENDAVVERLRERNVEIIDYGRTQLYEDEVLLLKDEDCKDFNSVEDFEEALQESREEYDEQQAKIKSGELIPVVIVGRYYKDSQLNLFKDGLGFISAELKEESTNSNSSISDENKSKIHKIEEKLFNLQKSFENKMVDDVLTKGFCDDYINNEENEEFSFAENFLLRYFMCSYDTLYELNVRKIQIKNGISELIEKIRENEVKILRRFIIHNLKFTYTDWNKFDLLKLFANENYAEWFMEKFNREHKAMEEKREKLQSQLKKLKGE
jgi:ParB family chromosome partitioning protein